MKFFIILLFFLSACHLKNSRKENQESVLTGESDSSNSNNSLTGNVGSTGPVSFIDSVKNKYEISISQLRHRTILDSVFFTGFYANSTFVGDTVVRFANNFLGAILDYHDNKMCEYKMIFIFDSIGAKNTAYDIISSACDHADDAYTTTEFKLFDKGFETTKSYYPAENDSITKVTREVIKWKVNSKGMLDSTYSN